MGKYLSYEINPKKHGARSFIVNSIRPPFSTEQAFRWNFISQMFAIFVLWHRKYGDVYQFLFWAKKNDFVESHCIACEDHYKERHAAYGGITMRCLKYRKYLKRFLKDCKPSVSLWRCLKK